jgi:capsular exopolysaccharide synthesis family protein
MTNRGLRTLLPSEALKREEQQKDEITESRLELPESLQTGRFRLDQATVLRPPFNSRSRLVSLTESGSLGAEKFMLLAARLQQLRDQRQLKKVVLTSSVKHEGKSLLAANLALSLAGSKQQRVLLLEGDLRHPALPQVFGCVQPKGLTEAVYGKGSASKFLYRMDALPLWLFFAGALRSRPLELLQSPLLIELLADLEECFDWIVIDAPPVLPLADADLWVQLSDGVLLVVRNHVTPRDILQRALDNLDKRALLGVILNEASGLNHGYDKD